MKLNGTAERRYFYDNKVGGTCARLPLRNLYTYSMTALTAVEAAVRINISIKRTVSNYYPAKHEIS